MNKNRTVFTIYGKSFPKTDQVKVTLRMYPKHQTTLF